MDKCESYVLPLFSRNTNSKHLNTNSNDNQEIEWTKGSVDEMKWKGLVTNTAILIVLVTVRHQNVWQYYNTFVSYRHTINS